MRRLALAAGAAVLCSACALVFGPETPKLARLDEASVRAFAAGEEAAWNARDFDHFFAAVAPDATFVSVRWNGDGSITSEKRSPDEDRAKAEEFFRTHPGTFAETATIDRVVIAPDGLTARIVGRETARISAGAKQEVMRATTEETVVLREGRILSLGQTDTAVR